MPWPVKKSDMHQNVPDTDSDISSDEAIGELLKITVF